MFLNKKHILYGITIDYLFFLLLTISSCNKETGCGNTNYSFIKFEIDNLQFLENDTLLIREIFGVEPQSITYSKKSSKEMRKLTKEWIKK